VVCLGAGAAGIASMKLLQGLGADPEKLFMIDRNGIIQSERDDLNKYKQAFAVHTDKRTLADAMDGADVFIGVSGPDLLSSDILNTMAPRPIVFALSNPDPEILPELAHMTRDDLIMGTGRSDYPNQVNNVLGFPYIFKGALDVRASCINQEMQIAAVHALAELTHETVPQEVLDAYEVDTMMFGPEYIIPKPLDPRLIDTIPRAVSKAAIATGVARRFPKENKKLKEAQSVRE
jgi:malate dehydrogenase (oxaloacetate-decarboxylating)(NADP+)